jgi:hypothetical protein
MGLDLIRYTEEISVQEIENLIIRNTITDGSHDVTQGLLAVRHTILEELIEDERALPDKAISGKKAEKAFREAALKGYKTLFPETKEDDENLPMWPDSMPYDIEWPEWLVRSVGHIMAKRDALEAETMYRRARESHGG